MDMISGKVFPYYNLLSDFHLH